MAVPSLPPEAQSEPSGETVTQLRYPVWPARLLRSLQLARLHTCRVFCGIIIRYIQRATVCCSLNISCFPRLARQAFAQPLAVRKAVRQALHLLGCRASIRLLMFTLISNQRPLFLFAFAPQEKLSGLAGWLGREGGREEKREGGREP
jgi:hypothetical protein